MMEQIYPVLGFAAFGVAIFVIGQIAIRRS